MTLVNGKRARKKTPKEQACSFCLLFPREDTARQCHLALGMLTQSLCAFRTAKVMQTEILWSQAVGGARSPCEILIQATALTVQKLKKTSSVSCYLQETNVVNLTQILALQSRRVGLVQELVMIFFSLSRMCNSTLAGN